MPFNHLDAGRSVDSARCNRKLRNTRSGGGRMTAETKTT